MNAARRRDALLAAFVLALAGAGGAAADEAVIVRPGPVASFEVRLPARVRAGAAFDLEAVAKDAVGNVVTDYDATGGGAVLSLEGAGEIAPGRIERTAFAAGVARLRVSLSTTGRVRIAVRDLASGARGLSDAIEVAPGPAERFDVRAPDRGRVGEALPIEIVALDAAGNVVTDYPSTGRPAALRATGIGTLRPAEIPPGAFLAGTARVSVSYDAAEEVTIVVSAGPAEGRSRPVRIRAGPLHEFRVRAPERSRAGEHFRVAIEALDAAGNAIQDFDQVGAPLAARATGRGRLEPSSVPPSAFRDGIALVHFRYDAAEAIRIEVADPEGTRTGSSGSILVGGGDVARFDVAAPPGVRSGDPFEVQVWAYDAWGNLVRDLAGRPVRLRLAGAAGAPLDAPLLTDSSFVNGIASAVVVARAAGPLVIEARDEATGALGRSREIEVRPGPVAAYEILPPDEASAEEPFSIEIVARDAAGNVVDDYDRVGPAVALRVEGAGEFVPASVPPAQFVAGRARVLAIYRVAETIRIAAEGEGGAPRGVSAPLAVRPGRVASFEVDLPRKIRAGEPFTLRLIARDRWGNAVEAFGGGEVRLEATGTGVLRPTAVPSAAFRGGAAEVEAVHVVAGPLRVRARLPDGSADGLSQEALVQAGPPARLGVLLLPADLRAGEEVPLRVDVRDTHGNLVPDFEPPAISLAVRTDGPRFDLGAGPPLAFRGGVAILEVVPQTVGEGRVVVEERVTGLRGAAPVRVRAGPFDRFEVLVPGAIRAGEPTKIGLLAVDAAGNVVADFGADGRGARLEARGTGRLWPSLLAPSLFRQGRAEFYVVYDRAEALRIAAEPTAPGAVRSEIVAAVPWPAPGGARLALLATAPVAGASSSRPDPRQVVVEVPGARLAAAPSAPGLDPVEGVDLEQEGGGPVRVRLRLARDLPHRLSTDANLLAVSFDAAYPVPLRPVPAEAPRAPDPSETGRGRIGGGPDPRELIRAGEFEEARRLLEVRVAEDPTDAEAADLLRRVRVVLGLDAGGGAGGARPSSAAPAETAGSEDQRWEGIERMVRDGRYEEALRALGEYERARPDDARAAELRRRLRRLLDLVGEER